MNVACFCDGGLARARGKKGPDGVIELKDFRWAPLAVSDVTPGTLALWVADLLGKKAYAFGLPYGLAALELTSPDTVSLPCRLSKGPVIQSLCGARRLTVLEGREAVGGFEAALRLLALEPAELCLARTLSPLAGEPCLTLWLGSVTTLLIAWGEGEPLGLRLLAPGEDLQDACRASSRWMASLGFESRGLYRLGPRRDCFGDGLSIDWRQLHDGDTSALNDDSAPLWGLAMGWVA